MIESVKVLDHGYVRYVDHMGTDEGIIEAARMSTGRGFEGWDARTECEKCGIVLGEINNTERGLPCPQSNPSSDDKSHAWKKKSGDANLLDFMYRNKHATPFEMCELQIEVQAPIMVFREWHRSRTQSYNEFSARYSVMPNLHYVPEAERFKPNQSTNKQEASAVSYDGMSMEGMVREHLADEQQSIYHNYENTLEYGVPKEVARINTPVSRYSKMRAKTDLRNWLGFLNLRMRPNAQLEIRLYANAVAEIIKSLWPRSYALFEEYDLYGANFGRYELEYIRGWLASLNVDVEHLPEAQQFVTASRARELIEKIKHGGKKIM